MKSLRLFLLTVLGNLGWHLTFAQLTYKDVAPIIYQRCTYCHRPGGGGPFSLMTYSDVYNKRGIIEYMVQNDLMPPWPPDTSFSRFVGERVLTYQEKQTLLDWLAQGAPAGDTTLAPPPPPPAPTYQIPHPADLEVQIPVFQSNASTTQDAYNCFVIPLNLTSTRYVRAIEIVPGNPDIVHHVLLAVDTSGSAQTDTTGGCFTLNGQIGLGGYAPGSQPIIFPSQGQAKMGIPLPVGSNLVIQLHYPAGSGGQIDSTKIRLFLYPPNETGIRQVYTYPILQKWGFVIPADSVVEITHTFDPASIGLGTLSFSLFSTFPHCHLICTYVENVAFNGSDTIPLVRIPKWDFDWQGFYTYKYLVKIPAGYKFYGKHIYDNTSNNPNNPYSPPQPIFAGEGTTDEMFFDSYQLLLYLPGDEYINIDSLLKQDTLVTDLTNSSFSKYIQRAFVFPNPARNQIHLSFGSPSPGPYILQIYTPLNQKILELSGEMKNYTHTQTIILNSLPTGVYFYQLMLHNGVIYTGTFLKE